MRILVTGSEGFIGSHLVEKLEELGQQVNGFDLENDRNQDVANPEELMEAVKDHDHVFHLAAESDVWDSDYDRVYRSNIQGLYNVVKACRKHDASMSFSSSLTAKNPQNLYARSKRAGELLLEDAEAEIGWIRFSNVVGPGTDKGQVQAMVNEAVEEGKIEVWENGNIVRSYVSVHRVVEELINSIGETGFLGELGTHTMTNLEMAEKIQEFTEADIEPVEKESPSPTELRVSSENDAEEGKLEKAVREQVEYTERKKGGD